MAESLPYQWMQTLAVALKAYSTTDANWDAHKLAKAIWTVVHEELRNKRQGRTSHMPILQGTGATAPATAGAPLGRVVRAPGGQAVVGAPQGGGTMLLLWATWTLGTPMPASSGHGNVTLAPCASQDIIGGGPDDPH